MTVGDQIRMLCAVSGIRMAELARRLGMSPQNFSAHLKRESFTATDLEKIAEITNTKYIHRFEFENGDKIE